jgi:site-specific recombinase XerD
VIDEHFQLAIPYAAFLHRLLKQLGASPHTIASYRDTFRRLLPFASERLGRPPAELHTEDFDASFLAPFLDHLELKRGNCTPTRNNRLAALHAFFQYAAVRDRRLAFGLLSITH